VRVQRFPYKTARVTRLHAPWARAVVKVGDICIAYESAEEAREMHGNVRALAGAVALPKAKRGKRHPKPVPMVLNRWGGVLSITFGRAA